MISIYLNNNKYKFPNSWEKLTKQQYLALIPLLQQYSAGTLSVSDVKALWLMDIAGLNDMKIHHKQQNLFSENIYRISSEFTFIFDIEYPDGSLNNISPDIRRRLRKNPPETLEQTPEVRYISKLNYQYKIALCWCRNLLPKIKIKDKTYTGYTSELKGNMLNCSLIASQFNFATTLLHQFEQSGDTLYLRMLVACLYLPDNETFKTNNIANEAELIKKLDDLQLFGILLNFQALLAFIKTKTKWGLLWKRKAEKASGLSIGTAETLYNLSQRGYGDFEKVDYMPLTKFLDLMLKDLYDSVKTMKDHEMEIPDIAEKAGLTINQVKQIL